MFMKLCVSESQESKKCQDPVKEDDFPKQRYLPLSRYGCVLLLIVLVTGLESLASERHMLLKNPLVDAGLIVLDASSPDFMTEIQKLLDPEALAKASPFLPYSLVIVNNTGQYVWGFTVVYTYPNWISPAGTPWKHRISPSAGGPADRRLLLAPGSTFLITPVSDFLASRNAAGEHRLQPFVDEEMDRVIEQFQSRHNNTSERIEVSIDSVIFEDGTLAGPDSEKMIQNVNEWIRAEKDFVASISNLRGADLRAKLLLHSQRGMGDEYSSRMSMHAHSMLALLNDQGESVALQVLETMRTAKWFSNSEFVRKK